MNNIIAETILKRRRELNLTQEELASRLGVSAQAVSNRERKSGYPDVLLIPPLAAESGWSWFDSVRSEERFTDITNRAIEMERKYKIHS